MDVCEVWLEVEFLTRAGFVITVRDDRCTAARDGLVYLLDGVCRHPADQCPPIQPGQRIEVAA